MIKALEAVRKREFEGHEGKVWPKEETRTYKREKKFLSKSKMKRRAPRWKNGDSTPPTWRAEIFRKIDQEKRNQGVHFPKGKNESKSKGGLTNNLQITQSPPGVVKR